MKNSNYEVDILIDGKPIRKIAHDNKLFIEARKGKEYSIRIKNNSIGRIFVQTSVDGLCVMNGKSATDDSNGYVISGYNSLTVDGFRVSDSKVARFTFEDKINSYAASKNDNSEKNVGVIGVRIYSEKIKAPTITIREHHWHYGNDPYYPTRPIIWYGTGAPSSQSDNFHLGYVSNNTITTTFNCCANNSPSTLRSADLSSKTIMPQSLGFDVGTGFGKATDSHVVEVEFERGELSFSSLIYYASRDSLSEMGVPLKTEPMVAFPEAFKESKYASPPKGWQ